MGVLEHQKKIEMERQKQEEYEMNQRRIVIEKDAQRNLIPKQNEENELKIQLERRRSMEVHLAEQQEEERKRIAAELQKRQEEERKKLEMERQRQIVEAERQRVIEQQKQEEARKKAEIEKQKVLEMQRREEERKRAEAEKQRQIEIQRQEEERRRAEEERLRLLQIQRQQEEQKRAEEERLRLLEMQRQQEEAKLRMEAEKARQEEERRLREENQRVEEEKELKRKQMEQMEQQRLIEMQTLHQSIQSDSFLEEIEKRQKIHEEQLRILRQKQEEEQKQLLMLQQQEEALWESKKSFIERSSSMLGSSQTVMNVTNTVQKASFDHYDGELIMAEAVKVHNSKCQQDNLNHVEEELIEYSAPVIHDGSRPSSVQSVIIPEPTVSISPEPIEAISPSSAPVPPPRGQRNSVPPAPVPAAVTAPSPVPIPPPIPAPVNLPPANNFSKIETPTIVKNDIVDDPLQFLLSNSPVSACSSLSSPSPVSAATSAIPSAPAPPPLQPSYASMATGDAIAELRSRFNETPVQAGFNDPVPPSPPAHVITSATSHNPPSKMHPPPDASYNGRSMVPDASYNGRSMVPDASYNDMRSMPASPTRHSSRPEVVSPASQKKRLMAQCMSEVASLKNAAVLPSNVKSARKKTTKSRVERFIEATCGEPQTVVRKTASGKEYLEVISPESTETARSLLEPPASR